MQIIHKYIFTSKSSVTVITHALGLAYLPYTRTPDRPPWKPATCRLADAKSSVANATPSSAQSRSSPSPPTTAAPRAAAAACLPPWLPPLPPPPLLALLLPLPLPPGSVGRALVSLVVPTYVLCPFAAASAAAVRREEAVRTTYGGWCLKTPRPS